MLYKLKPANWEAQSLCESPGQEDQSLRDNRGYCQEPGSNLSKIFLGREEVRSLSALPVFGAGATSGRPKPRMKPIIRHMSQGPGGWKLLAGLSVYLRSAINPTGWGWEFYRDILRHSLKLTAFRKCFFPSLPQVPGPQGFVGGPQGQLAKGNSLLPGSQSNTTPTLRHLIRASPDYLSQTWRPEPHFRVQIQSSVSKTPFSFPSFLSFYFLKNKLGAEGREVSP